MTHVFEDEFKDFLKTNLNKPQLKSVKKKKGSLQVIAGAGSGKTRVITSRITNLILNEKADPLSIVALTFTNKAAGEMKERITKFLGARHELPFVGTFHSYCLFLLRSNPTLLPYPQFSIMDTDDKLSLIKKIVKKNAIDKFATPYQLNYQISQIKNKIVGLDSKESDEELFGHPILKEIYLEYEAQKAAAHCFDFDDLILQALQLFKNEKEFKKTFQKKIKHILVDEYQDTSHVQHELLRQMALSEKGKITTTSLCVVGDEDQSIYSWRGATVTNMLKFQQDFAPVSIIKIEQNYRTVEPILEAANDVIKNNKLRNPKKLWTDKKAKNRILLLSCRSGEQEADVVATYLKNYSEKKKLSNAAILYRTHYQSRILEEALIYHGLPYRIVGGIRFYERREIKDLLAYLRLIVNPHDKISLSRIINVPLRGLGAKFEEELMNVWIQNPFFDFKQLLKHVKESKDLKLTTKKKEALDNFLNIYDGLDHTQMPSVLIDEILKQTDYLNFLRNAFDGKEADTKIENIQEFVRSISTYEVAPPELGKKKRKKSEITLENFLYEVSLMQEKIEEDSQEDQVQLMTLHAAKGLEFDSITITGLEEGVLPSSKSLTTNEELEEERRLFYVGMTRAKERLVLTAASYRNNFGQIVDQVESRFMAEINKKLYKEIEVEKKDATTVRNALRLWLGLKPVQSALMTFGPRPTGGAIKPARSVAGRSKKKPAFKGKTNQKKQTVSKPSDKGRSMGGWGRNIQVHHKKFGMGIVVDVEPSSKKDVFQVTAIFKVGKKKILSNFLTKK